MPSDRECMEKAVDQACLSKAEPGRISPKVGAVVVNKDGEFLAQAHRGEDQDHKDHAEFYALEKKLRSETLADATVFTTLEPCFERSEAKTACARRLVARRVNRVFIGMLDPDPSVHGKGQIFLLVGLRRVEDRYDLSGQDQALISIHAGGPDVDPCGEGHLWAVDPVVLVVGVPQGGVAAL